MKKSIKISIIIVSTVLILGIIGYFSYPYILLKDFNETLGFEYHEITKINLMSGNTGKITEITEKTEIEEFLQMFKDTSLKKSIDQLQRTGFTFSAKLYAGDDEVAEFSFGTGKEVTSNRIRYILNRSITEDQIYGLEKKYDLGY